MGRADRRLRARDDLDQRRGSARWRSGRRPDDQSRGAEPAATSGEGREGVGARACVATAHRRPAGGRRPGARGGAASRPAREAQGLRRRWGPRAGRTGTVRTWGLRWSACMRLPPRTCRRRRRGWAAGVVCVILETAAWPKGPLLDGPRTGATSAGGRPAACGRPWPAGGRGKGPRLRTMRSASAQGTLLAGCATTPGRCWPRRGGGGGGRAGRCAATLRGAGRARMRIGRRLGWRAVWSRTRASPPVGGWRPRKWQHHARRELRVPRGGGGERRRARGGCYGCSGCSGVRAAAKAPTTTGCR